MPWSASHDVANAHASPIDAVLRELQSSPAGLSRTQAAARLTITGPNALATVPPPSVAALFARQLLSPLIYILMAAAGVSLLIGDVSDAAFILVVLLVNAAIGATQEYGAQRSAANLSAFQTFKAQVQRDGEMLEIDSRELVPGDIVWLASGSMVPADLRLLATQGLEIDESLLTGESQAAAKRSDAVIASDAPLAERIDMAFSGTLVMRGRGQGVVVATGAATALGAIAHLLAGKRQARPPLLLRMERFTRLIGLVMGGAILLLAGIGILQQQALHTVFLTAVALAVAAIPEGLPVALTVALSIGMRRMARRNVIVRRLMAVEALGSCTLIASDKTGTLTVNELTVRDVLLPCGAHAQISGEGIEPRGEIHFDSPTPPHASAHLNRLAQASALANEAVLSRQDGHWHGHGDAVDVALLSMAHKLGIRRSDLLTHCPALGEIPYESEQRFSASAHMLEGRPWIFVKGALETLLPMCTTMQGAESQLALDPTHLDRDARQLASHGQRVLAIAAGPLSADVHAGLRREHLQGLNLLGLIGLLDPPRAEAVASIAACREAGVRVIMITGDHPRTAAAIGAQLGLIDADASSTQVITGSELQTDAARLPALVRNHVIFARVEPRQKLQIVEALQQQGEFVAVTGDGANDAPALRAAHVGAAMGKAGTDVARESADLILTDDNFASIVAGIEEGRIAYANVRKVIALLISTGAAELVLMALTLAFQLPLPLLPVQLLWLNLVTEGIQHVGLAFEPGEGDELRRPPRPPNEPIFDRLMIRRVVGSAAMIGVLAFSTFQWLLAQGHSLDSARNLTLLLMVLFENVQVFNARSDRRSVFRHSLTSNPLLLFGTLGAQMLHIAAMHIPRLGELLHLQPISLTQWVTLLGVALVLLLAVEIDKWWLRRRRGASQPHFE